MNGSEEESGQGSSGETREPPPERWIELEHIRKSTDSDAETQTRNEGQQTNKAR